ncbi:MAG: hypothetical protein U1E28_00065 [Beijerinckiaceae bacterium]
MYHLLLRQLEHLQRELAVADPTNLTQTVDAVGAMAASLRRLDDRIPRATRTRAPARGQTRRVA